jgi:hypothetical protein
VEHLALSAPDLVDVLRHYLRHPQDRVELGTDAALRRIDELFGRTGT